MSTMTFFLNVRTTSDCLVVSGGLSLCPWLELRLDASAVDERIRLRTLDWNSSLQPDTDIEIFFHKECDPELVLGSDIVGAFADIFTQPLICSYRQVYNPEFILPLVATLRLALAPTEASAAKRAILALSVRNEVTFVNFMTKLQGKYHELYCYTFFICVRTQKITSTLKSRSRHRWKAFTMPSKEDPSYRPRLYILHFNPKNYILYSG
jgi:hypothetical protein